MKKEEVINAIQILRKFKTETNKIEAKSAKEGFPKKCYDTISNFSNKSGGIIIFGIDESNNFISENVYDVNDLQKQITSLCKDSMVPSIRPEFLPIEFEGKNILAVKINEIIHTKKPCYYRPKGLIKGSYTRIGDSDEIMTDYEIYTLQSYNNGVKEDLRLNIRASLEDLNHKELNKYIKKIKIDKPNFAESSNEKILNLSGLTCSRNSHIFPTLTGTLVFGEYPQGYYP